MRVPVILAVVVLAACLAFALAPSEPTPRPCFRVKSVPCLTAQGKVLAGTRDGGLELVALEDWRRQYSAEQYDLTPPFAGPGPNAP